MQAEFSPEFSAGLGDLRRLVRKVEIDLLLRDSREHQGIRRSQQVIMKGLTSMDRSVRQAMLGIR